ncbi:MAG: RsmB/NOP family class I SAM-dependent RNA methyltransferase [Flammeovirgaceae bacterium]
MKLYRNLCAATVEGLTQIFSEHKYADKVIEKILKSNPKWGGRDRRFIAETTYDIVRWYRLFKELANAGDNEYWKLLGVWCVWKDAELPDWDELKGINRKKILAHFEQIKNERKMRESIPDWLDMLGEQELGNRWPTELEALNEEAKVVLRANTLKISAKELQADLADGEIESTSDKNFPDALILARRQNVFTLPHFKEGLFEVQDAGSQAIAPFLKVEPGMRVVDACAGAGGKSLHLASLVQNKGKIISLDTEQWKLDELKKRARRAGASNIETRFIENSKTIKRLENACDRLLLDVPCSGSGVLKRNPDAKWKLNLDFIARVKELQEHILNDYCNMVKPGGLLVYSTCSLLTSENEDQVKRFLKNHPGKFELQEQKTILPSQGFDGFYMARIVRL